MAEVSFMAGTIGLQLPFIVQEGAQPISNAISAVVTWLATDGRQRLLTMTTPVSAVFTYVLSAQDYPAPRWEMGQLRVSIGMSVSYQAPFQVHVTPHI